VTPHDRELHKALYEMPLVRRLAFVLSSIVVDDRAAHSVELIIEVALTPSICRRHNAPLFVGTWPMRCVNWRQSGIEPLLLQCRLNAVGGLSS
jgi:hypothetical protein